MVSKELLGLLVCPETHQPLHEAPRDLIDRLNAEIATGQLRNRSGQTVLKPIEAGLLREDRTVLYPVVDGIPIMLGNESIAVAPAN